ncbi:hypothetical protein [Asaia prunellae]|nr:hypothetical protein [Asaia prunellae]
MTRIAHFSEIPDLHRATLSTRKNGLGLVCGAILGGLIALGSIALLML